ncbi:restriction endonuclease subunit S [Pseudohoeflea coraliihabitans]|uniref:Restriction endonuclease subunit S n=1 Tax=Pseudohoeflea coraliihabitans TaxID=2860393 RepID=A0ABS6WJX4_9HYPH|nr:restriction endonuclease subunit S [Pseudohoeflea sp. DP4N28-3]MBW3096247.1 restriction endonuclease subunit S [Pseudohoeflea sp. DP4N28-3]
MSYFARSDELPGWAAHVPEGWGKGWLKWSVGLSTKRPTESEQEALPYISNEDIASWTGKLLVEEPKPAEADSRTFQKDDVLFNKLRPYLAKVYHATFDGVSSGELLCLRPSEAVEPRFLFYVLVSKGFVDTINSETFGSKMPRADWETVGHQPLPLPPLETQQRVARFLDEKTARIDALIEKKRALLDRLAEKRQALITRAVTKGLNPNAPMKPSGIDWLGDIPANWQVKRLSFVTDVIDCKHRTPEYVDDGIPLVSTTEVKPFRIDYATKRMVSDDEFELMSEGGRKPGPGDIIYSRNASVGSAALVRTADPLCLGQDLCLIRPKAINSEFLEFFLNSRACLEQLDRELVGATFKRVNVDAIKKYFTLLPPAAEQDAIAAWLNERLSEEEANSSKVEKSLDLLVEYRAAIITASVTGQVADLA